MHSDIRDFLRIIGACILGEKLRALLVAHGSWDKVEVTVKEWHERKKQTKDTGGYKTKQWLMDNRSFSQNLG